MNPATVVLLVCAFAAGVVAVLTVGTAIRDAQRTEGQFQRRIGNGVPKPEPAPELMARDAAHSLDRWFYLLVERSGTRLSIPTAMTVVAACTVVGCGLGLVLASNLLAAAAGLLLGGALPVCWWLRQQASRLKKMRKNLPGAGPHGRCPARRPDPRTGGGDGCRPNARPPEGRVPLRRFLASPRAFAGGGDGAHGPAHRLARVPGLRHGGAGPSPDGRQPRHAHLASGRGRPRPARVFRPPGRPDRRSATIRRSGW